MVELPGDDHLPFVGDQDAILDEIENFLRGVGHAPDGDRVLATVLFIRVEDAGARAGTAGDDSGRRARLAQFQAEARRKIEWFRGREIKIDNGEMFTIFDGPARALRCACRLTETAHRHGFTVRAGLHTGECDVRKEGVSGVAVSVAAHVMERARPGEVLSSSTVKDLVAGSGIQFSDCGDQTIEGLPGKLGLCRVEQGTCM